MIRVWTCKEKESDIQCIQLRSANGREQRLIDDTEYGHHIRPLRFTYELGNDANVVQGSLRIGHAHDAVQEVDNAEFARVVER